MTLNGNKWGLHPGTYTLPSLPASYESAFLGRAMDWPIHRHLSNKIAPLLNS